MSGVPGRVLSATFLKDLKLVVRDRGHMASLFLMPLIFIVPICLAFPTDGYNKDADRKPKLPLANFDVQNGLAGTHSQSLIDALAESYRIESGFTASQAGEAGVGGQPVCAQSSAACDEAVVRAYVSKESRPVGVVIPAGLSAAVDAGQRISITLVYNPTGSPMERQLAEGVIQGSAMQLSIRNQVFGGMDQFRNMLSIAPDVIRQQIERVRGEGAVATLSFTSTNPALAVTSIRPSNYTLEQIPSTLQQTVPGYTVMFAYFLVGVVVASVQMERHSGMLRRMRYASARRSTVLSGKTAAAALIGVVQVGLMFGVGHFGFGMGLGSAPVALALLTLAMVLSAAAIGLAAAAYHIERGITLVLIVGALIAGCTFPADWLPPFVRAASLVLPQTWAMQGYQDLLTRNQGLAQVLPEIGVLMAFTVVAFVLAARRFEFE